MKCSNCGYNDETDSLKFCPRCGIPLRSSESLDKKGSERGSNDYKQPNGEQNNSGEVVLLPKNRKQSHLSLNKVMLLGVCILTICLLIYAIRHYNCTNNQSEKEVVIDSIITTPIIEQSRIEQLPVLSVDKVYYAVYFLASNEMLSNDNCSIIDTIYHIYYDKQDGNYRYYLGVWEQDNSNAITYAINFGYDKAVTVKIQNGKNIGEYSPKPINNGKSSETISQKPITNNNIRLLRLYNEESSKIYWGVKIATQQSKKNKDSFMDIFKKNPSLKKILYYEDRGSKVSLRYVLVVGAWPEKSAANYWLKKIKKVNNKKYRNAVVVSYQNGKIQ